MTTRNVWLDVLRAAAVVAVVAYHVVQQSPVSRSALAAITHYGQYGVDLFFALSGWLIGTLFWKEYQAWGDVQLWRFWCRRAIRTVPPYLVALLASWVAVYHARSEPFDFGYLIFIQNYYRHIPFFLVSWSLCVEEQFYVIAPLLSLMLAAALGLRRLPFAYLALLASPSLLRFFEYTSATDGQFGYGTTATHLHMDGLIAGFGLSFLALHHPALIAHVIARRAISAAVLIGCFVVVERQDSAIRYVLLPTVLALLFCLTIAAGVENDSAHARNRGRFDGVVRSIAVAAYSAYLVHPLAIHAAVAIAVKLDPWPRAWYWPVVAVAITGSTLSFWWLIERPSIHIRDIVAPRR